MSGEELLAVARKHMWAAWQDSAEELASQAASTLLGLGMLVPEGGAAELEKLRVRVAELEAEREKLVRWHGEDGKTINRLVARVERRQAELVAFRNDALNMRGSLAPADEDRKVPFELGETLAPAVDWLIARVAELEKRLADEDPIAYALTGKAETGGA